MSITLGQLLVEIIVNSDRAQADLRKFGTQLQDQGQALNSYGQNMMKTGAMMTAGISVPLMLVGKQMVDMASSYQENMNILGAVTGATSEQMTAFGNLAKQLGADMSLPASSSSDAAAAMVELSKAGMGVNDVLGATRGVLQLSTVGQMEEARAAEILSNALNVFGLAGTEAARVTDMLAAGANVSSADVTDMADSMQMAAAVFAQAGIPIEDLTTMIAEMANKGIKGSDAGTSLKQMVLSLIAPSDKAAETMEQLGISIYDTNGSMLDAETILENFQSAMGGLSEAQRNAAMATIFGSDAIRAGNIVLLGGVDAYKSLESEVVKTGMTARTTDAMMLGLPGSMKKIQNAVENMGTAFGNAATGPISGLADAVVNVTEFFTDLNPKMQETIVIFGMVAIATGPVITGLGGIAWSIGNIMMIAPSALSGLASLAGGARALYAGLQLLNGASSLGEIATLATTGAAGFAAVALPIAAIAGSIAAVAVAYDHLINKTNSAGVDAAGKQWENFFDVQLSKGSDSKTILEEYTKAQTAATASVRSTGMLSGFVDQNGIAEQGLKNLSDAMAQTTGSYEEYQAAMLKGLGSTEIMDSLEMMVRFGNDTTKQFQYMIDKGMALNQVDFVLAQSNAKLGQSAANAGMKYRMSADELRGLGIAGMNAAVGASAFEEATQKQQIAMAMSEAEAQQMSATYQGLRQQQETLQSSMTNWTQTAASGAVQGLSGLNVESERYLQGLQATDEIMGTNYFQQQNLTNSLNDLGRAYRNTGDLEAYKSGLQQLKDEGLSSFKTELEDATTKAQGLYDKLKGLPSELQIKINFDVEDLPDFLAGASGSSSKKGGGLSAEEKRFGAEPMANGGDLLVTRPTLFLAGEAGWEHASFTPVGKSGGSGGNGNITIQINGNVDKQVDVYRFARQIASEIRRQGL